MINLKLFITYNGTNYYGWQKQKLEPTIQQAIEDAFRTVFNFLKKISLTGSGRTDRGVHAIGQVANIKLPGYKFNETNFLYKINSILPLDIKISSYKIVNNDFNARFDAEKREYRYFVLCDRSRLPFYNQFAYYYPYEIDFKLIKKCLKYFKGTHDFTSFSNSDKKINPNRIVYQLTCRKKNNLIMFKIIANSFLQGMVRNIIATILDINKNKQNPEIIKEIFHLKNNSYCADKIPGKGLFLYKVYY